MLRRFDQAQLRRLNVALVELLGGRDGDAPLGLERAEDLSVCLIDSTCLEANIHFPVDWVLLKDVALTLLKALQLIRKEACGTGCLTKQKSSSGR